MHAHRALHESWLQSASECKMVLMVASQFSICCCSLFPCRPLQAMGPPSEMGESGASGITEESYDDWMSFRSITIAGVPKVPFHHAYTSRQ